MKTVTYAIGDIHGRLDLLDQLLETVRTDAEARRARSKIVFTGDYMDRGANSCGVVERLMAGPQGPNESFVCLQGNHDDLFVRAVAGDDAVPEWAWMLFSHTITSYGVDRHSFRRDDELVRRHVDFLSSLPLTHDDGINFFVHAGIRPGVPLAEQTEQDLLWIRDPFLNYEEPLPRRVIHGHTIMGDQPVVTRNRISIDTGAFRSGRLTAAVLDGEQVAFLQAVGEPDAGAILRETIISDVFAGRPIQSDIRAAHADFLAGRVVSGSPLAAAS